jgi:glycosyltransferase involved in cell wall biosynthesis
MMRILYDHQVFSLQSAGGASRYYYELVRALAGETNLRLDLWLGMNDTAYPFRELASPPAHVVGWRGGLARGSSRYVANEVLGNALAPFAGTVDVYHPTLYRSMPLVRARRLVATHHDCAHERYPELFANAGQIVRAKRRLYARADAIICVSQSSRQDLFRFYGVPPEKTRVIYHGLRPLAGSVAAAVELRARVPSDYLLFVGSRAAYKNFDALLRAFKSSGLDRDLLLLVAGGGPLSPAERALARELHLGSSLVVIPQIPDAYLAEAYAAATLLVYPSRCEGFGFPPLEAMAAGCPVLASCSSSLPEVCLDAPFYFDPEDPASLERALPAAVWGESARRRARKRGREVASLYRWKKCARETLALYRECQ